jgi:hypothetical protein
MAAPKRRNAARRFTRSGPAPGLECDLAQDPSVEMAGGSKHNIWGRREIPYFSRDSVGFFIDNGFIFRDSKTTLKLVDIATGDEVVL